MRSRVITLLGIAGVFMVGACSSATEKKPNAKTSGAATKSEPAPSANGSTENTATAVVTNGMYVPPQTADANAGASDPGTLVPLDRMRGRLDKMRQSGASSERVDVGALAMKNARPAPENSTFTSYLAEAGYEIRTFQSHPQLLKVEKRTENTGNQTLKIFLRNGKVVQRPGKDIAVLSTSSSSSILAVAGIVPQPPRQPASSGSAPTKKSSVN